MSATENLVGSSFYILCFSKVILRQFEKNKKEFGRNQILLLVLMEFFILIKNFNSWTNE